MNIVSTIKSYVYREYADDDNIAAFFGSYNALSQGNLDAIQANGVINEQITNLTDANKTLLQTSSGAATIYNQALTNMANTIGNPNLSAANQATSLNDQVQQLNSALNALSAIGNTPGIDESLDFTVPSGTSTGPTTAAA